MEYWDNKLTDQARKLIKKFPRLKFMLPHLSIYLSAGIITSWLLLKKAMDPLPNYDIPNAPESKSEYKTGYLFEFRNQR